MDPELQTAIDDAVSIQDVSWSICLRDEKGDVVASHQPDASLSTASVGKVLLLVEAARQLEDGLLSATEHLQPTDELAVAGTGLWRHLTVKELPLEDVAVLTASVSDNLATNVLLQRVGLEHVQALTERLGMTQTALLDRVRSDRGPQHAPALSVGSASDLSWLMGEIARGELISPSVSATVSRWLTLNVDLSLVLPGLGLDPLAHGQGSRSPWVSNKTGGINGVRADVGFLKGPSPHLSFAVIANWKHHDEHTLDTVLSAMRGIGERLKPILAS